ncbi:hypothetical protein GOODEAATRI_001404 [Goodea atripinnis]|uniref:Uncharacterized protein n=1 Tax=Goodea atripinnis TaxID=208336 RepID=A0ABV0MXT9_9TELE
MFYKLFFNLENTLIQAAGRSIPVLNPLKAAFTLFPILPALLKCFHTRWTGGNLGIWLYSGNLLKTSQSQLLQSKLETGKWGSWESVQLAQPRSPAQGAESWHLKYCDPSIPSWD